MSENENTPTAAPIESAAPPDDAGAESTETAPQEEGVEESTASQDPPAAPVSTEEISYHAVEKDGQVTAIWEMQGRKHLRTIDPRSHQGQEILRLYTSDHHEEANVAAGQEVGNG